MALDELTSFDLYVQHQVHIAQFARGEIINSLKQLERMQNDVISRLNQTSELTKSSKARLQRELSGIVGQIKDGYDAIGKSYEGSSAEFALSESRWQAKTLSGLSEGDVAIISFSEIAGDKSLNQFEGKPFTRHLADISKRDSLLVRRAVVDGVALGRSNREIGKTLEDALKLGKRDIQTLVRTGIQSNAAAIRDQYFAGNQDIVRAVWWVATLDGRTTVICRTRDGLQWEAISKKPISHGIPWIGGPPAHFNCRSASVPDIIGLEDKTRVGFDFNKEARGRARSTIRVETGDNGRALRAMNKFERGPSKRMGKGRQFDATIKFSDWFDNQPKWFQESYLGKKKARLFRKGGLPLEKFSEKASRSLTLDELEKLFPRQWKQAFGS